MRAQLLELYKAGAEQETESPYLLAFVNQERRVIDWKAEALALAVRLYGTDQLTAWNTRLEQSAPVQSVTQIRIKPNPAFAADLKKPTSLREMAALVAIQ